MTTKLHTILLASAAVPLLATPLHAADLTASDGTFGDRFAYSLSLSGGTGLVGAFDDDDNGSDSGSAYVFRNLDAATGSVTQNAKLTASDGASLDYFSTTVSLSDGTGLIGAYFDDDNGSASGSAYLFRNLDTATNSITENVILNTTDVWGGYSFGQSVSLSGSTALVGADKDDPKGDWSGSAFLFLDLDTASGTVTQDVKLIASDGVTNDQFGFSVSLDGDNFLIGAFRRNNYTGKAYTGSVGSVTTLDEGNTNRTIDGISFISRNDWTIGRTTDNNTVHLTTGDAANVTVSGKAVYIGKNTGSDDNTLILSGALTANEVHIGSLAGNEGNTLQINSTATFDTPALRLAQDNALSIEGDYTAIGTLLSYLDDTELQVWDGNALQTVTALNHASLIASTFSSGYTVITPLAGPPADALAAWRFLHFGTTENTGDAADGEDPDGDGRSNIDEFIAGTHPVDPADVFHALSVTRDGGVFTLVIPGKAGRIYQLQRHDNLAAGPWNPVGDPVGPLEEDSLVELSDEASGPRAFYRTAVSNP